MALMIPHWGKNCEVRVPHEEYFGEVAGSNPAVATNQNKSNMETSVTVRVNGRRLLADICLDSIDISSLCSLDNEWLRNIVRPQVAACLRLNGVSDPKKLDECVRAIVDGTPPPPSSSPKDKSGGQASSNDDTPPRTTEDS